MVLALDYMQTTKTLDADLAERAATHVAAGYRRLRSFESDAQPGGFGLWGGDSAPRVFLTAYGLMQFADMRRVHDVEPALIERMVTWLKRHHKPDGSFRQGNLVHSWGSWKESGFYMTAYVAWALAHAGEDVSKALAWLDANGAQIEDPYGIALATMAFATADRKSASTQRWVERVAAKHVEEKGAILWRPTESTFVGGRGRSAEIEATALSALALLTAERRGDLAYAALDTLISWRGKDGRFGPTHSTALALRALLAADGGDAKLPATAVKLTRRGAHLKHVAIPEGSTEPIRVPLGELDPKAIGATLDGQGRIRATLSRTTYEPWNTTTLPKGPLAMTVSWAEGPLGIDRPYAATVTIRHTGSQLAKLVTAEVGLPPGITVEPKDVMGAGLSEAEKAERAVVLYLTDMKPGEERTYTIPFRTRHAFQALTAPSRVYEYYVEHEETVVPPVAVQAK